MYWSCSNYCSRQTMTPSPLKIITKVISVQLHYKPLVVSVGIGNGDQLAAQQRLEQAQDVELSVFRQGGTQSRLCRWAKSRLESTGNFCPCLRVRIDPHKNRPWATSCLLGRSSKYQLAAQQSCIIGYEQSTFIPIGFHYCQETSESARGCTQRGWQLHLGVFSMASWRTPLIMTSFTVLCALCKLFQKPVPFVPMWYLC